MYASTEINFKYVEIKSVPLRNDFGSNKNDGLCTSKKLHCRTTIIPTKGN